jgi:ribosomal-protein-alanine N-acetyltransferase
MIDLQAPDWWIQVPELVGATLRIREVEVTDADALFDLLTDPLVRQYISPPPPSVAAFEGFVGWAHRQREAGQCICFAVVPNGLKQPVGLFQLRALEPTFKSAEWGFAIGAAFWSTGLFEEAAALVAQFAFQDVGVHRLEARAVVENSRGNRALEKLGARSEAVLQKAFHRQAAQFLWAIVAEEWKAQPIVPQTRFDAIRVKRQIEQAIAAMPLSPIKPKPRAPAKPGSRFSPAQKSPLFPFFLTDPSGGPPKKN